MPVDSVTDPADGHGLFCILNSLFDIRHLRIRVPHPFARRRREMPTEHSGEGVGDGRRAHFTLFTQSGRPCYDPSKNLHSREGHIDDTTVV